MSEHPHAKHIIPGAIVQLVPDFEAAQPGWGGALVVVQEVRSWGVQGFVQIPGTSSVMTVGGRAYIRATWKDIEWVGSAVFLPEDFSGEDERT